MDKEGERGAETGRDGERQGRVKSESGFPVKIELCPHQCNRLAGRAPETVLIFKVGGSRGLLGV